MKKVSFDKNKYVRIHFYEKDNKCILWWNIHDLNAAKMSSILEINFLMRQNIGLTSKEAMTLLYQA